LYIVMTISCAVFYGIMCVAAVVSFVHNFICGWKGIVEFETGFSPTECASSTLAIVVFCG
jgi:hypothetical protein